MEEAGSLLINILTFLEVKYLTVVFELSHGYQHLDYSTNVELKPWVGTYGTMDFLVHLDGKTYDLTHFVRDHPGGINTLKNYKGKPVLQAMEKFGHSSTAYHMLKDFEVKSDTDENLISVSANGRIVTKGDASRNVEEIAFLEELESRLDWTQPLVAQLHAIAPHYGIWVNSAVYRKCKLFANPVIESLTFTPWYLVPLFWVPVIIYLTWLEYPDKVACGDSCENPQMSLTFFVYQVFLGVLIWSLLEYSLHRWVFHLDPGNNINMIKIHFLIHGLHHKMPFDDLRQVFPPVPAVLLLCILYCSLSPLLWYPSVNLIGSLIGYLSYDMIHYYVHHGAPRDGTYLYAMKRYHSNHHFSNHDKAFGISTKLWDHVFRTFVRVRKLGFSLQW